MSKARDAVSVTADVADMDLALPRLRAHATAMLLVASAALTIAAAVGPHANHTALVVRLATCGLVGLCAVVTWRAGERFGDVTLGGLVLLVTILVTLSATVSRASASNDVMLFFLPAVFAACFLRAQLALCTLIVCCAAYGWLVSRQLSTGASLLWWTSATIVFGSAAATVSVLRHQLTGALTELDGLARCDPLTGLLNRRGFDQRLEQELERCARTNETCAVLMCDLDCFKAINDLHGHAVGDAVLKRVASDLLSGVRAFDTVARIGGEEIALLLVGCDCESAMTVAERLRQDVGRLQETGPGVAISIGVADSSLASRPSELMAYADRALYDAKRAGRDRVCKASAPAALVLVA
jgi:diguanylate cyclase (GGDEF)-like protein